MANHHFISYSSVDGFGFAIKLADALEAGATPPSIAAAAPGMFTHGPSPDRKTPMHQW